MTEYREILSAKAGQAAWSTLENFIDLVDRSGNVRWISPHYQFRIISADLDDNAFTDCAIAANADYVITEDSHFAPLANAGFKPQPITPDEFIAKYRGIHV
ncbi:MAG: PIN domain-containing protein [Verrucomicrobiaceae bacterium]|nr:PIN domain-containing protein [Verrucomicrobiaceae bacterium]